MITKRKNILSLVAFIALIGIIVTGCKKDDHTGFSTLEPVSGVVLTITPDFTSPVTLVEADSTFNYTITLNNAQLVDLKLYIKVDATTATAGDDFDYLSSIVIPAGSTTAKGWVKIFSDTHFEEGETFSIQVGDATFANADFTPVTYEFNVNNLTGDDLVVSLSWTPSSPVIDLNGDELAGDVLADMILTIYDGAGVIIDDADGSTYEELVLPSSLADGNYYVATSFYGALDLGDQGGSDLDFSVNVFQLGIQDNSLSVAKGMHTVYNLANERYLAIIEKIGTTWTLIKFEGFLASDLDFASGSWSDGLGDGWMPDDMYPNQVVVAGTAGAYTIDGLCFDWMLNSWGETVTTSTPVNITFNDDGTIEILDQYYMTTDYLGAPYDYHIYSYEGGTWNRFLKPIALTINYEMNQAGFELGAWGLENGYSDYPYFIADIVQSAPKSSKHISNPEKVNIKKPY